MDHLWIKNGMVFFLLHSFNWKIVSSLFIFQSVKGTLDKLYDDYVESIFNVSEGGPGRSWTYTHWIQAVQVFSVCNEIYSGKIIYNFSLSICLLIVNIIENLSINMYTGLIF